MFFIVLEGLDGAGKSTQVKLLTQYMEAQGKLCKFLHFPRMESGIFGDLVARFLRGDLGKIDQVHPYLVALIYAEDRHEAAATIRQWLAQGYVVIVDRYVYSNIAFQGAKCTDPQERHAMREWILNLEYGHFGIPKPDLSLFMDVPFDFTRHKLSQSRHGDDRQYLQGKQDIHEQDLDFQNRVRSVYLEQVALEPSMQRIDCVSAQGHMLQPQEVFAKVKKAVEGLWFEPGLKD